MTHTKGPWFPINYAGYWDIQTKDEYSETSVLHDDHYDNAEANAKLCAAAPDLLEACIMASNLNRFAREHIDDEFFIKINQAIQKATE